MVITEERLAQLAALSLSAGSHSEFARGVCAMEAVAYIAGEPHSDAPACACPVLTAFMIAWNDGLPSNAERDRLLKPFIPRLVDTRSTREVEERRAFLAMDWVIRVHTPTWLDLVDDLKPHAAALRALDAVHDLATLQASTPSLRSASRASAAAWDAARAAAWDAARAAAWDAARGRSQGRSLGRSQGRSLGRSLGRSQGRSLGRSQGRSLGPARTYGARASGVRDRPARADACRAAERDRDGRNEAVLGL
jgi:hypothetical protein